MTTVASGGDRAARVRWIAVALLVGTVLYIAPSALHGNPPIESAEKALRYVHDRPTWRIVHLVNILAVLLWAGGFSALAPLVAPRAVALRRAAATVFAATAAVFAVYFSIHAFGLPTLANDFFERGADQAAVLERTETVLVLLGSTAFTAQAMLGLSIALCAALLVRARPSVLPAWLGWVGVAAGAGWLVGALLVKFSVIVPFTVVAWVWWTVLAVLLLRRAGTAAEGDMAGAGRPERMAAG